MGGRHCSLYFPDENLRLREVKRLVQGHTARKRQDLIPGSLSPEPSTELCEGKAPRPSAAQLLVNEPAKVQEGRRPRHSGESRSVG